MNDDQTSPTDNSKHFVVAIGASAGGLAAMKDLLAELPSDLDAPVVIGSHSLPESSLKTALELQSSLTIKSPEDGELLEKGTIYVVPGARHAFFRNGRIWLSGIVQNSGFRPSIDAMFMTLAAEYKERSIAVILSGTMKDGMRGAQVIYDMGGRTIVQDPEDAAYSSMPESVIRGDHPTAIRTASELGEWLRAAIKTTS